MNEELSASAGCAIGEALLWVSVALFCLVLDCVISGIFPLVKVIYSNTVQLSLLKS
jgi:hypothetical protein